MVGVLALESWHKESNAPYARSQGWLKKGRGQVFCVSFIAFGSVTGRPNIPTGNVVDSH